MKVLAAASFVLVSLGAFADPLPLPDPCSVARAQQKGETCKACDSSDPEVCKKEHASDGFELRCKRPTGYQVWCKSAPRTKK